MFYNLHDSLQNIVCACVRARVCVMQEITVNKNLTLRPNISDCAELHS